MVTFVNVATDKSKTLTLKLDLDTLAEFAVSAQIHRARSVSSFVHEYVVRRINEARQMVSPDEFERRVEEQKEAISARSKAKQRERRNLVSEGMPLAPTSKHPIKLGNVPPAKTKRKTG
jgi:hypothetical protein